MQDSSFLLRSVLSLLLLIAVAFAPTSLALDREHRLLAEQSIDRGIEFLRSAQNPDGSWTPQPGPAITALAITALLDQPDIDATDPTVAKGIDYILKHVNEDGSIHGGFLANYNTAISISALTRVNGRPDIAEVINNAMNFLIGLQWGASPDQRDPEGNPITREHPFYGGSGYGRNGRPDMSNTHFMLQALHDAGLNTSDPAFERALVFITRCQGIAANDMFDADTVLREGGFIYSTTVNRDNIGVPESKANPDMIDEAKAGRPVSGLRSYGSMTYAGFKSYIYADLQQDDPRVVAALNWLSQNYDPALDRNPGMPDGVDPNGDPWNQHGLYYMYITMGRAMSAFGETYIEAPRRQQIALVSQTENSKPDTVRHDWANDLIAAVVKRQREDGSWSNAADRWMEGDPSLVTAYCLIALQEARQ